MRGESPLVSVCMVSYNQETFVRDALDSILMQKTTFPFEIIISDDCSNDGTVGILNDYQEYYPDIVKPILGKINIKYPNNQRRSLEAATGKYVALCDADDYWTDPYKLQKQVDYLESHSGCVICFHNVMNVYEGLPDKRSLLNPLNFPTELTVEDVIMRQWFLPTNSEIFRREFLSFPDWYDSVLHIDYVINALIAQYGYLHYLPDVMAVYRHTGQSVSVEHQNGTWGYVIFHCKTMKTILTKLKDIYAAELHPLLEERIKEYDKEIKRYEYEQYCENHLLVRIFRIKTYRRLIRKILQK